MKYGLICPTDKKDLREPRLRQGGIMDLSNTVIGNAAFHPVSDHLVASDGRHNLIPRICRWRGEYWLAFRNGSDHRSYDSRIVVTHSPDLESWPEAGAVIDTAGSDDRDPTLFVIEDRLFVTSMVTNRKWEAAEDNLSTQKIVEHGGFTCLLSYTDDGISWSDPRRVFPFGYTPWWTGMHDGFLYATVQRRFPMGSNLKELETLCSAQAPRGWERPLEFITHGVDRQAELWRTRNGLDWEQISIVCDERQASESPFAVLPDGRMVALVRHDDIRDFNNVGLDGRPEVRICEVPYSRWRKLLDFDFWTNASGVGFLHGRIITCGRAVFENPHTPLNSDVCRERKRGQIMGIIDPDKGTWVAVLALPVLEGPRHPGKDGYQGSASQGAPDIANPSFLKLEEERFALFYTEGYKGPPADIRLAIFQIS